MTMTAGQPRTFVKGHGTGNDFLLFADPDNAAPLAPHEVAALADRHTGLGADGVIRAVRSAAISEGVAALAEHPGAVWFMDYVNADGSVAQMCGNGLRVFVAFLRHTSLIDLPDGGTVDIVTRAGVLNVRREGDEYAADMGQWSAPGGAAALAQGCDASVTIAGIEGARPGLRIDMPNPHTVIALEDVAELDRVDLVHPPTVEPVPAAGTNVELVVPLAERELEGSDGARRRVGVVRMRVHERGVGETLSCGTGACAAALAVRSWLGDGAPDEWQVLVPGGELRVRMLAADHVELAGPAQLVAEVSLL